MRDLGQQRRSAAISSDLCGGYRENVRSRGASRQDRKRRLIRGNDKNAGRDNELYWPVSKSPCCARIFLQPPESPK